MKKIAIILLFFLTSCHPDFNFQSKTWPQNNSYELSLSDLVDLKDEYIPIRFSFSVPEREGYENGSYWTCGLCSITYYDRRTADTTVKEQCWYEYGYADSKIVIYGGRTSGVILFQSDLEIRSDGIIVISNNKRLFYHLK